MHITYNIHMSRHTYHILVYMHVTYNIQYVQIRMCMHITYIHLHTYIHGRAYVHTYIHVKAYISHTHVSMSVRMQQRYLSTLNVCTKEGGGLSGQVAGGLVSRSHSVA
jgi:hypothetical protein